MRKPVKDLVNKEWAAKARVILTGNSPDTSTLFTKLSTITLEEQQKLKSDAARDRFTQALHKLRDGLNFGWAHGFNASQARFTRPENKPPNRRVGALLPLAIAAGEAIGKAQAAKVNRAHGIPAPGTFPLKHTHATGAPATQH